MTTMRRSRAFATAVIAALATLIFAEDFYTEAGVANGILYIALIWAAHVWGNRRHVAWSTAVAIILIWVGFFISPSGEPLWTAAINRALSVFAVLLSAGLSISSKRAQSRLRNEVELNRRIAQQSLDAMINLDASGRILSWNPAAEEMFGWSAAEAVGRQVDQLLLPERWRQDNAETLEVFLDTGKSPLLNERVEMQALHRSGREVPVEVVVTPVVVRGRQLFCVFARDISAWRVDERHQRREMLASRIGDLVGQARTATIDFDQALRGCLRLICEETKWPAAHAFFRDDTGAFLVASNVWWTSETHDFSELVRVSRGMRMRPGEVLAGKVWQTGKSLWIDDVHAWPQFRRAASCPNLPVHSAYGAPVIAGDDVIAVLEFFIDQPTRPDEEFVRIVETMGRQLGAAFESREWQKQQAQTAAIVESSADAIISRDLEGRITSWNAGATATYGYAPKEAIGEPVSLILPVGQDTEEEAITSALLAGRVVRQFETVRRRKDGELIFVSLTISPIRDQSGRIVGSATIERDITDRKLNEERLRSAKEAAEEARAFAEQAMRVRSDFLANVSHELRTPMNSILGMAQLALEEDLSETVRGYVETAYESGHSLLTLLNDILDFAKLEAGKFTIEKAPFDLQEMIEDAVHPLSSSAFDKGLELSCDVAPDVPTRVVGDAVRLRQVLTNLLTNAIKFTEQGEVSLQVRVREKWKHEVRLEFTVRDTGVGIAVEDQQRMLEPFTQVDTSTTRRFGGTGLGLAICNELLRLMGGQLSIESRLGDGSAFSFALSLPRQPMSAADTVDATPFETLRDVRVLVVDDNATNRRIMRSMLRHWRAKVDVAGDAEEAIGKVMFAVRYDRPYELVILDALMPGVDGYELSRRIVAETGPGAPVLLMASSSDRRHFRDREDGLPIAAFIEKPVLQSELLGVLMSVLDKAPQPRSQSEIDTTPARPRRTLSVLVVEDTHANQQVVSVLLKKRGHSVTVAQNGREAVEKCRDDSFDVILMDIQMPIMDGYQATASIRQLDGDGSSRVPIVAMTAHAMRGDRERCLASGMDTYISKPIDAGELLEVIEGFSRRHLADESDTYRSRMATDEPRHTPETTPMDSPHAVINVRDALKRLEGDEALYADLAACFLEDAPALVEEILGLDGGQVDAARIRAAHSLKGLAATVGADALSAAAGEIQCCAEQGDSARLSELMSDVKRHYEVARNALAEVRFSK